jgi:RNA polymerase sigma-70 factor, ECF subfamily
VQSDSRQARFEREMLPHLDAAYNLARWILRGSDDAQDVTQDAILRALRYFDSFHGGNAKAWLLRIVRNTCYSWIKARPKSESMSADEEGDLKPEHKLALEAAGHSVPAPDARLIKEADRQLINEGMQALPTDYREILILREIEELSYRDISEIADIPIGTVMSRLSRARAALLHWVSRRLAESGGAMR